MVRDMSDVLPRRDVDLSHWAMVFAQGVAADPGGLGVSLGQSEALLAAATLYRDAYAVTSNPSHRSPIVTTTKNDARARLSAIAREVVRVIRAHVGVSPMRLAELGLLSQFEPDVADAMPAEPPTVWVEEGRGGTVTLTLRNPESPSTTGRPRAALGAAIFSWAGEAPPEDPRRWHFETNTTRTRISLPLPADHPPGTKVWYYAAWLDTRLRQGKPSVPVSTFVQFDAFSQRTESLKAA